MPSGTVLPHTVRACRSRRPSCQRRDSLRAARCALRVVGGLMCSHPSGFAYRIVWRIVRRIEATRASSSFSAPSTRCDQPPCRTITPLTITHTSKALPSRTNSKAPSTSLRLPQTSRRSRRDRMQKHFPQLRPCPRTTHRIQRRPMAGKEVAGLQHQTTTGLAVMAPVVPRIRAVALLKLSAT